MRRPVLILGLLAAWLTAAAVADAATPAPAVAHAATPAPAVAVDPANDHRYVFWRGADGQIHEAWNDGAWHGPINLGWQSASGPTAAASQSGHEYVLWRGKDGDIHEVWYIGGWHGPIDLTTSEGWGSAGKPSSPLSVAVNPANDHQYVFWLDARGRIRESWYDGNWHRPIILGWHAKAVPSATVTDAAHQFLFWQAANGHIREAWYTGRWHGPADLTSKYHWGHAGQTTAAPAAAINPRNGHQYVFWRDTKGHTEEAWFTGRWHAPHEKNWTPASAPALGVTNASHQYLYWVSTDGYVTEAYYRSEWVGPVARWSLQAGAGPYVEAAQTTPDLSQRLTPLGKLRFSTKAPPSGPLIAVNDKVHFQQVQGVGGAITDSTAWLIYDKLSASSRMALMNNLFGPYGIHLNYLVVPIGGSDFTRGGVPYTYDDLPSGQTDPQLVHFSIAHDQAYVLPVLQQMRAINPQSQILAVPWSAPAWMKANNALNDAGGGGTLMASAYQPFANYFVKFLQAYSAAGVTVNAIAPENEPNAWSLFPAMRFPEDQEAEWVTADLRPALAAADLDPKVYGGDTGWGSPEYAQALASSHATQDFDGIAWHCYGGAPTVMAPIHAKLPHFAQPVAECAQNLTRYPVPEMAIGALRNWATAVTLWNLALDPNGQPVEPPNTGCGGCRGIVTIDPNKHTVAYNLPYYQLGQIGSFVEPNAWRIGSNSFVSYFDHGNRNYGVSTGVDDVALLNPDGSRVLVAYNTSSSAIRFSVAWQGRSFTYSLPSRATVSFRWDP
jgi:glucosylceramidase